MGTVKIPQIEIARRMPRSRSNISAEPQLSNGQFYVHRLQGLKTARRAQRDQIFLSLLARAGSTPNLTRSHGQLASDRSVMLRIIEMTVGECSGKSELSADERTAKEVIL